MTKSVESLDESLFTRILRRDIRLTLHRSREMLAFGRCVITGTRDDIIEGILDYMSELDRGDSYTTVTTADFWGEENLGIDGRFLACNQMLIRRGVRLQRLFLTTAQECHHPESRQRLSAVLAAQDRALCTTTRRSREDCTIGVLTCNSAEDINRLIMGGRHVGVIRKQEQALSLSFESHRNRIQRVTIWQMSEAAIHRRQSEIEEHLGKAQPIGEFLRGAVLADALQRP